MEYQFTVFDVLIITGITQGLITSVLLLSSKLIIKLFGQLALVGNFCSSIRLIKSLFRNGTLGAIPYFLLVFTWQERTIRAIPEL